VKEQTSKKSPIAFFRKLIRGVLASRFQIIHFGVWSDGVKGEYGVMLYYRDVKEQG
jgi:hypothetical protein